MEIIAEITEKDFGFKRGKINQPEIFRKRVNAVVLDKDNYIALIWVGKENYYQLPGGRVEIEEDLKVALKREVLEEAGVDIEMIKPLGTVIEHSYKGEQSIIHSTDGYLVRVLGEKKPMSLTDAEKDWGMKVEWLTLDDAITRIEANQTDVYHAKFNQLRELFFLKKMQQSILC